MHQKEGTQIIAAYPRIIHGFSTEPIFDDYDDYDDYFSPLIKTGMRTSITERSRKVTVATTCTV